MQNLINKYKQYHPVPDEELIKKAYDLAQLAYSDIKRLNGENWLNHALEVAHVVTDLKMDTESICAALLHDSYQFGLTPKEIEDELGSDVRELVDNIYSMRSISTRRTHEFTDEQYAEYLRRVILSMGRDLRAVVIRLADKLSNLHTADVLDEKLKKEVINSAFTVYAPLADLAGVYELKWQIEDVAFKHKSPNDYKKYRQVIFDHIFAKDIPLKKVINSLYDLLLENGVNVVDISGRQKATYSFYKKVNKRVNKLQLSEDMALEHIYDKVAFRVIVESVEDCYAALDVLHQNYNYIDEEFDDYIAEPKTNGYRSIQTTIELEPSYFSEIQIKTKEMHEYNEFGPASHVFYKLHGSDTAISTEKIRMLKQLLQWRDDILEEKSQVSVKDIAQTILVFTPKGEVIELPVGSTPIDFAYAIHTGIGNKAVRALVDGKLRGLDYKLKNGEVVKIVTDPRRTHPSIDWLGFVKTKIAKTYIKKNAKR